MTPGHGRTRSAAAPPRTVAEDPTDRLVRFLRGHERIFVLTGAGVSTESGIPDYRDANGDWKRPQPVQFGDFVRSEHARRRYWARSLLGWRRFTRARPSRSHRALAMLESMGRIRDVVTQNVDGLHRKAGSRRVIDLHGRLDRVVCLGCDGRSSRSSLQDRLERDNPGFAGLTASTAPDGDADLDEIDLDGFQVPQCERCDGTLKPAVVFFGESVPPERVADAFRRLEAGDAVLVVGSSLMVWSGYRFCRAAAQQGLPIAAINLGRTRADELLTLKIREDCGTVLARVAGHLAG